MTNRLQKKIDRVVAARLKEIQDARPAPLQQSKRRQQVEEIMRKALRS